MPLVPAAELPERRLDRFREAISYDDVIEAWLAGKSPNTMAAYQRDLETFRAWLEADTLGQAVELLVTKGLGHANMVALAWKRSLVAARLAPKTINRRLAALRSAVKLCKVAGKVEWVLDVQNVPSRDYRDTTGPGVDGYKKLLAKLDEREDVKATRRDRCIVVLLFAMALRRKEVQGLNAEDIDFARSRLRILGKGRTETEWVTMPDSVAKVIRDYLDMRGHDNGPLLLSEDPAYKGDGRLSLRSISRMVKNLGEEAKVDGARPHGLRHAAITAALDATKGDVRRVQKFSRHSSVQTVLTYDDNRKDLSGQVANELDQLLKEGGESS